MCEASVVLVRTQCRPQPLFRRKSSDKGAADTACSSPNNTQTLHPACEQSGAFNDRRSVTLDRFHLAAVCCFCYSRFTRKRMVFQLTRTLRERCWFSVSQSRQQLSLAWPLDCAFRYTSRHSLPASVLFWLISTALFNLISCDKAVTVALPTLCGQQQNDRQS